MVKSKKILSVLLALVMALSMIPFAGMTASAAAATLTGFAGGDGSAEKPYQISSVAQLANLAEIVNGGTDCTDTYFELTDNIGSTEAPVTTVIGNKENHFNGHFDGKGFTVTLSIAKSMDEINSELSDLKVQINEPDIDIILSDPRMARMILGTLPDGVTMEQIIDILVQVPKGYVGLFSWLDEGGEIKNVTTAGSVNGQSFVGGVCGYSGGTLTSCYNTGTVNGQKDYVGGVCGYSGGTLTSCYNTGTVNGQKDYVGGVCGNNEGTVTNCYNTGTVTGASTVGGVCGGVVNGGSLTNCYNVGNVGSVKEYGDAGGVCGFNVNGGTITNCYNAGSVNGNTSGGVCGGNDATMTNCYYNSTVYSGNVSGYGNQGTNCYGLPTEQMQAAAGSTLTTGVANNKPLVDLLNEYVNNNPSAGLKSWTNKQGKYPVFGTPHTHSFTGEYVSNGDGTYSKKCSECDVVDTANKITATDYHILNKTCETNDGKGAKMGHQDKIGAEGVGRAIICLTQADLEKITEDTVTVVGGDKGKQATFTLDCAYTYFYAGDTKYEAKNMGYAAFLIIDHNANNEAISGYGYYAIYNGNSTELFVDALFRDPVKTVSFKNVDGYDYYPIFDYVPEGVHFFTADGVECTGMTNDIAYAKVISDNAVIHTVRNVEASWDDVFVDNGGFYPHVANVSDDFSGMLLPGESVATLDGNPMTRVPRPTVNDVDINVISNMIFGQSNSASFWSNTIYNASTAVCFDCGFSVWKQSSINQSLNVLICRDF